MSIITTYVCDVSGVQGSNREDFVDVQIQTKTFSVAHSLNLSSTPFTQTRMLHKDAAKKLGLLPAPVPRGAEPEPDPTSFEQKIVVLLKDWMTSIAQEEAEAAVDNNPNRN